MFESFPQAAPQDVATAAPSKMAAAVGTAAEATMVATATKAAAVMVVITAVATLIHRQTVAFTAMEPTRGMRVTVARMIVSNHKHSMLEMY